MRIIELIPNLQVGGAERFVVDLSNALARKGHEIIVATLYDRNEDHFLEKELINVKRIELHKNYGLDIKCLIRVLRLLSRERPDIVHTHGEAVKYVLLAALLRKDSHYYATIHSDASYDSGSGINLVIRSILYKRNLVRPVTISNESKKSFYTLFGIDAPMIENGCTQYIQNNNPIPDFHSDVDYLFVHVASIQQVKNQIVLVKAFKKLLDNGVNARLLFLGRPYDESIFNELKSYWSDSIVYLGQQPNIRDYLSQADAFCLTSTTEGMPISLIEALSVGCPLLVTPAGGCISLVEDGVNGYVSDSFSEESYYMILERFVALPVEKRNNMRSYAKQQFIDHFQIDSTADKYLTLFMSE